MDLLFNSVDKLLFQFLLVRLKEGTIHATCAVVRKFQFLLVRLKESTIDFGIMPIKISIPSGAIKRVVLQLP